MFVHLFVSFLCMVADEKCHACRPSPITIPSMHAPMYVLVYILIRDASTKFRLGEGTDSGASKPPTP